jgi:7-keto-8-aminopelargonate synthetase-like enzyme
MFKSTSFYSHFLPDRVVKTSELGELLFFGGTSYLGLGALDEYRSLVTEGLNRYGTAYGSSRSNNLRLHIFEETERALAQWVGSEACLCMSSGFMAGQLIAQWVRSMATHPHTQVCYAPDAHPALWCGLEQPSTKDFTVWLTELSETKSYGKHLILVTNAVDAFLGRVYTFELLEELCNRYEVVTLIADDSHGIGVTGVDGKGVTSRVPNIRNLRCMVPFSLNKALATPAGAICAPDEIIESLRSLPFYNGASPAAPAQLYAFLHARPLIAQQLTKLQQNMDFIFGQINDLPDWRCSRAFPVFFYPHHELYRFLLEERILISSFAYPKPDSAPITRLVVSALHTHNDLATLAEAVIRFSDRQRHALRGAGYGFF